MADDILITVGADVKGVVTAIDTTRRLENRVNKLVKAYETGRIAPRQFDDALSKVAKSAASYGKSVDNYAKSLLAANQAEREATAAAKAAKQEALALSQARKEQIAVERKAKEEARAFAQVRRQAEADNKAFDAQRKQEIATIKAQAAEEERLRRKYVEGYAAMDLYSKELNELAVARKAGIISADQQRLAVERLNQQMASGTGVFSGYGKTMQEATTRNNRMGVVFQQTGYQVGDFLVQIQSGTNPMVAFGQQATQLAGVMTMFGGKMLVIGSILGIAIPLVTAIGAAFLRSRQEAAKAAEDVKTLDDELKSLDQTLQDWVRTKKAAEAGITIEELLGGEGLNAAKGNLKAAREELEKFSAVVMSPGFGAAGGISVGSLLEAAGFKESEADKVTKAAETYIKAIERIGQIEQKQAEDQYKTFAEEDRQLRQQIVLQQQILKTGEDSAEVRKLSLEQEISNYNRVIDQQVRNNELTETQGRLLKEQNALVAQLSEVSGKVNFSSAEASAQRLVERLGISVDLARKLAGLGFGQEKQVIFDPRDPNYDPIAAGMQDIDYGRVSPFDPSRQPKEKTERGSAGGGKSEAEEMAERITKFEEQLRLEEELNGKTEARKRIIQALGVEFVNQNAAAVAKYEADIARITELNRLEEQRKQIMQTVESSMESGFMAMVDGTKSVKDAFRDMAAEIIKELYRVLVVQRMVGAISGGVGSLGSLFSGPAPGSTASILGSVNANGNAFFGGRVTPFANGGVVNGPTMFPMSGGQTGLMGEAGPEAIMPLKRDKNGRLGVSVDGGSGSVVVNNNINVTGGTDPAAIRMEVAKLMPQITNATKTAVIDARRRGGQMKAAFG